MSEVSSFRRLFDQISRKRLLTPHLEQALLQWKESVWPEEYPIKVYNKEREWDGYFHPSSHATLPDSLLYYMFHEKWRGVLDEEPPSVDGILAMQVGSAIHSLVESVLINLGFTTEEECEVSFTDEKRHCSGQVDIRTATIPNGQSFPVEIKSASWVPKTPLAGHLEQMQVYMDVGCVEPQQEVGVLLYMSKQYPHRFHEFVVKRDDAVLSDIYSRWSRVLEAVEFDDPSELKECCQFNSLKMYQRCPVRTICHRAAE